MATQAAVASIDPPDPPGSHGGAPRISLSEMPPSAVYAPATLESSPRIDREDQAMPRKKMPPQPQPYAEYFGFGSGQMRQRAMEAGCRTVAEMVDWVDKYYGDRSEREQNRDRPPPGEAMSVDHESPVILIGKLGFSRNFDDPGAPAGRRRADLPVAHRRAGVNFAHVIIHNLVIQKNEIKRV